MSNLVIVESPAKAKTIKKYLGRDYEVVASMGHVRDLPKARLSVDIKNDFAPKYDIIKGKEKLVKELKGLAENSDSVYLATDPDREGEAISWHLAYILGLPEDYCQRVEFNEITKTGVQNGMAHPRAINQDLVNAQQARRVLDRLVGYKLSPFISQKIRRGLSAGRVQSVALRIIVDRENEIRKFKPEEYWTIDAKSPAPPFITSTLQQEASRKLGFQSRRTMRVAQELYEGVDIEGMGATGLITYMRTDSLRISSVAIDEVTDYIRSVYGEQYLPPKPRFFKSRSNAQDGHEAIRPSMPSLTPDSIKNSLSSDQYKLYKLIWSRFTACQMADCIQKTTQADIEANGYIFKASGYYVDFPGFTALYVEGKDEAEEKSSQLPPLEKDMPVRCRELKKNQHFTQPPARFTEASLIKTLEEYGIGRPSTYAATITTLTSREYVKREAKSLVPTELGEVMTQLMKERFPDIVNVKFTAQMEGRQAQAQGGRNRHHLRQMRQTDGRQDGQIRQVHRLPGLSRM